MASRSVLSWLLLTASMLAGDAISAHGQEEQNQRRGVRFLLAALSPPQEVDTSTAAVLRRRVTLDLTGVTLREALREITRQADLEMIYSPRVVPLDRPVRIHARGLTVAAALTELLADVPVDVSVTSRGALALVRRAPSSIPPADTGRVSGRVTDTRDGSPLAGAAVSVEGTRLTTLTDVEGRYRLSGLPAGVHTIRARYIGFTPARLEVAVAAREEVTLDIALERSVQELEQVVVTGTIVPTEVKALPNPVTLIDEDEIAALRPQTVQELFRQAVPGSVGWNYTSAPYNTPISVRGASTLTAGTPSMKIFIDGVQTAASAFSQVDPKSIARMEVIRGPQAAAIYGSDAIGGVVQIFTKRGDAALDGPRVAAEAAFGVAQHPYAGHEEVLRQEYQASLRGAAADVGYQVGVSYSRLGDWLPGGELSGESRPSVYGGVTFTRGALGVDISGRYYAYHGGNNLFNPLLLETGFAPFSRPSFQDLSAQNQTFGVRVSLTPLPWWRSEVTAGIDRNSSGIAQDRPRLTTPEDTLLIVSERVETRTSVGVTSSVQAALGSVARGSLTVGADYWERPVSDWYAFDATNTTGSIRTGAGGTISATRTESANSGYFAQAQVGFHDAVFLTAGLRAERNSDFGDSLGTPVLPRVGLTLVRPIRAATVKLRGSWGRAIRAPSPGRKLGFTSPTVIQLPNPRLGPERQQGWDAGLDLVFGARGTLSLTYFRQLADDLADAVVLATTPTLTQQFQNVGQVSNSGVEVEGGLELGPVSLRAHYGYVRARIKELSPTYVGDLQVGDEPLLSPAHTAGASVSFSSSPSWSVTGGATYVGRWTYYDFVELFRCQGGTSPCRASFRDYQMTYPAMLKLSLGITRQLTRDVSGFVAIDNLTNNDTYEGANLSPVRGRTSSVGMRFQH